MSGSPSIESLKKPAVLISLGLFFAAFLLRVVGIGWGLPNATRHYSYHPDEELNFIYAQGVDVAHFDFVPGHYNYGTAYFIALNVAQDMVTAYGGGPEAAQLPPTVAPGSFEAKQLQVAAVSGFMGRVELAGRVISALAGSGAVVVLFLILRRITTLFGALFGAAMVGVAPGFLVHSRFETVDVFATFWLGLSALFALRILGAAKGSLAEADTRAPADLKDAILAGLFAGISTGSKYTGVLVLLVLWVTLALTRRPRWALHGLIGTVVTFVSFLVTTPGIILDSKRFFEDFEFELGHTASGHGIIFTATPSGFIYHLGNLVVGVGLLLTLAGIAGLAFAAYRRHSWAIALLAFGLVYYFVIGRAEVKFLRYTFPLLLPLAAGYGYAMGTARRNGGWGHAAVAGGFVSLAGLDLVGGLVGAARYTQFMTGYDPRDESAIYLRSVAANGSVGFVKDPWFYSPALLPDGGLNRGQVPFIYEELDRSQNPKVVRYRPPDGGSPQDWDVRLITESKPDYIVFSNFEGGDEERLASVRGLSPDKQAQVDRYKRFIESLQGSYTQVNAFGGLVAPVHDLMYVRPTVWVWKRKDLR